MKVTVTYNDNDSFLIEEILRSAKKNYGEKAQVIVEPESDTPIDHLYFAIQRLYTGDQISLLFESGPTYKEDLKKLKAEIMYKVSEVVDEVLHDNEQKTE